MHSGPKERVQSESASDITKPTTPPTTKDITRNASEKANIIKPEAKLKTSKVKEKLKTDRNTPSNDKKAAVRDEDKPKNSTTEEEESAYWERVIVPLLNRIDLTKLEGPVSTGQLYQSTCYLWDVLSRKNLLGPSGSESGYNKRRSSVLQIAYRLLDQDDPKLLIKLARIIFSVMMKINCSARNKFIKTNTVILLLLFR